MTKRIPETPPQGMVNCYTQDIEPDCNWLPLEQYMAVVVHMRKSILELELTLANERTLHNMTRQQLAAARGEEPEKIHAQGDTVIVDRSKVVPIKGRKAPDEEESKKDEEKPI